MNHPRLPGEHVDGDRFCSRFIESFPLAGEHGIDRGLFGALAESSPLAGSADRKVLGRMQTDESPPGCKARMVLTRFPTVDSQNHPRLRGGHPAALGPCISRMESSPLAERAQKTGRLGNVALRIIPACAEVTRLLGLVMYSLESSPLAGRACVVLEFFTAKERIIPARGESTNQQHRRLEILGIIPACRESTYWD